MALSARFSLLHSDLNDFLFASVGDEQNGMPLSVVSALTRLGLDPWEEAGRLAVLPKARAAAALARMMSRLTTDRAQQSDNLAVSRRLVELLPVCKPAALPGPQRAGAQDKKNPQIVMLLEIVMLLAGFGLAAAMLFSM